MKRDSSILNGNLFLLLSPCQQLNALPVRQVTNGFEGKIIFTKTKAYRYF